MAEFPAWLDIADMIVGRYGFAIKLCPKSALFGRGEWYVLRPQCTHISGPFGTRKKAVRCLAKPNRSGERQWGHEAASVWIDGLKEN